MDRKVLYVPIIVRSFSMVSVTSRSKTPPSISIKKILNYLLVNKINIGI
jgi:hypothetical protein